MTNDLVGNAEKWETLTDIHFKIEKNPIKQHSAVFNFGLSASENIYETESNMNRNFVLERLLVQ